MVSKPHSSTGRLFELDPHHVSSNPLDLAQSLHKLMEAVRKLNSVCLLTHACPISVLVFQFRLSPLSFYDKIPSVNNSWGVPTIRLFKKWWGAAVMKACLAFECLSNAGLIAGPGFTWKNISVAQRRCSATREKRRKQKRGLWSRCLENRNYRDAPPPAPPLPPSTSAWSSPGWELSLMAFHVRARERSVDLLSEPGALW